MYNNMLKEKDVVITNIKKEKPNRIRFNSK